MPSNTQLISPLRYPGSKALLSDYIADFIVDQELIGTTIVEPYAGSAIISFIMLFRDYAEHSIIIERDPLLYCFWFCVFNRTEELIERINMVDVTIETWQNFQPYRQVDDINVFPILDMGLAGLFFNRTNFSGILKAGPLGGRQQLSQYRIDCRFNKSTIIRQISEIAPLNNRVTILFGDALRFLINNRDEYEAGNYFLYIDPPYFKEGKNIYRYWYNLQDHINLSEFLLGTNTPWLVSYDDHKAIRDLYVNHAQLQQIYFDYAAGRPKRSPELLISNRRIPPLVAVNNELA